MIARRHYVSYQLIQELDPLPRKVLVVRDWRSTLRCLLITPCPAFALRCTRGAARYFSWWKKAPRAA